MPGPAAAGQLLATARLSARAFSLPVFCQHRPVLYPLGIATGTRSTKIVMPGYNQCQFFSLRVMNQKASENLSRNESQLIIFPMIPYPCSQKEKKVDPSALSLDCYMYTSQSLVFFLPKSGDLSRELQKVNTFAAVDEGGQSIPCC